MVYKKYTIWPQAAKPNLAHAAYEVKYPSWRQQSHATYCEKQLKITIRCNLKEV